MAYRGVGAGLAFREMRRCDECGGRLSSLHCLKCGKIVNFSHENSLKARRKVSLILGIASLVISPLGIWLGVIFSAASLYLAVKSERTWLIVFNIIALIISVIVQVWLWSLWPM